MLKAKHLATGDTVDLVDGPWHYYDKSGDKLPNGKWPVLKTEFTVRFPDGTVADVDYDDLKLTHPSPPREV